MNEKEIYPDGPITNGDKKLIDMLGMSGLGPLDEEPDPDFKKEMEEKENSASSSPDLDL